jgi:outer membrane protein
MRTKLSLSFCLISLSSLGFGQTMLTLDEAFKQAIANNFDIRILENRVEIAENSANIGNAGLLPTVGVDASAGVNVKNTDIEFAGGLPPTSLDNATSTNQSAGISANYVLFNGLSGQRNYQKLKLNKDLVDMQSQASIEATLLQVANAYYVLSRAIDQEEIATKNVTVSKNRYDRAKVANELGTSLRTEMLNARVAMTTDSSSLLNAQLQRQTAIRQLGRLMATDLGNDIQTEEVDPEMKVWPPDELLATALANNSNKKNTELQLALAEKDYQISWASVFPTLSVSGGYSYNNQQSEVGILLSNKSTGFNGAVALSYPLLNGFRNRTNRQNTKVNMEIRQLELQDQELQLATDIQNAFDTYKQSFTVARFEEKNLESAQLNLNRTEELYNNGQVTSTQFREAQLQLASAEMRISNAKISVKLNELEIMRLTGQILSE